MDAAHCTKSKRLDDKEISDPMVRSTTFGERVWTFLVLNVKQCHFICNLGYTFYSKQMFIFYACDSIAVIFSIKHFANAAGHGGPGIIILLQFRLPCIVWTFNTLRHRKIIFVHSATEPQVLSINSRRS